MPLTDKALGTAKTGLKPRSISDAGGLSVLIQPNGAKWWRFRYRFGGKPKLLSLGVYPAVSLKEARRRRDEYRQLVANGVNPSDQRKATPAGTVDDTSDSFESVAREWFPKQLPGWSEGHARTVEYRLSKFVYPVIGKRSMKAVTAQAILAMLKPIEEQEKYETARRVLIVCEQVCDYAIATGRIAHNPAVAVTPALTQAPPSKHFAAMTDPKDIGPFLRKLHGYAGSWVVMSALRLAPLVFVRPGELRKAKWEDIDLDAAEPQWAYRVSKTNTNHIVPLSEQAVAILRALHPHTSHQPFVFPGPRNGRPMSENALAAAMRTMDIPKETMSTHGFRAMARTCLDEQLHFPPHLIEHQLAHRVRDLQGRSYNRTQHIAERRDMMQKWAGWLDALRSETTA